MLLKGRVKVGQSIRLSANASASVVSRGPGGTVVHLSHVGTVLYLLEAVCQMPLPPYIKRSPGEADRRWYQTVFARGDGSVAAPTAGLHLTQAVLDALRHRGITVASVTLHVGPGTFRPVRTDEVEQHRLPPERLDVPAQTVELIAQAKARGGRIVAVGTTVVRALEAAAASGSPRACAGQTDLFIVPGYRFQAIDALLTNFHLPRSTLVMLVAAFAGRDRLFSAYEAVVKARYRFYSYGDAMLIL